MLAFVVVVWAFVRTLRDTVFDPEFRPVFGLITVLFTAGTVFYWRVEDWSLLDAAYFSVVTLATVGYGDLTPETRLGKLFTMAYIILGVGTVGIFINAVTRRSIRRTGAHHVPQPDARVEPADRPR